MGNLTFSVCPLNRLRENPSKCVTKNQTFLFAQPKVSFDKKSCHTFSFGSVLELLARLKKPITFRELVACLPFYLIAKACPRTREIILLLHMKLRNTPPTGRSPPPWVQYNDKLEKFQVSSDVGLIDISRQ